MTSPGRTHCRAVLPLLMVFVALSPSGEAHARPSKEEVERFDTLLQEAKKSPQELKQVIKMTQWGLCMNGHLQRPFSGKEDKRTTAAYAAFATRAGLPVEKTLSASLFLRVMEAANKAVPYPLGLPSLSLRGNTDYVRAKGTWAGDGESVSNPVQTTQIECFRTIGICTVATAEVDNFLRDTLALTVEHWVIERWDEHELVTKPNDAECVRWVLRINFNNKSVTNTRMRLKGEGECSVVGAKDWTLRLVDGPDVERVVAEEMLQSYQRAHGLDCGTPPSF